MASVPLDYFFFFDLVYFRLTSACVLRLLFFEGFHSISDRDTYRFSVPGTFLERLQASSSHKRNIKKYSAFEGLAYFSNLIFVMKSFGAVFSRAREKQIGLTGPLKAAVLSHLLRFYDYSAIKLIQLQVPIVARAYCRMKQIPYNSIKAEKSAIFSSHMSSTTVSGSGDGKQGVVLWFDAPFASQESLDSVSKLIDSTYPLLAFSRKIRKREYLVYKRRE